MAKGKVDGEQIILVCEQGIWRTRHASPIIKFFAREEIETLLEVVDDDAQQQLQQFVLFRLGCRGTRAAAATALPYMSRSGFAPPQDTIMVKGVLARNKSSTRTRQIPWDLHHSIGNCARALGCGCDATLRSTR